VDKLISMLKQVALFQITV